MVMTFSDLKAKHLQLIETKWKVKDKLQSKVGELLGEYVDSLKVPEESWKDASGNYHKYVEIGAWKSPGKFEPVPIPMLQIDENNALSFVIATTLDDNPLSGGYRHGVSITLWFEGAVLCALVGTGDDSSCFNVSQTKGGFYEVCAAIKALICLAIDRASPKALI
ncbi:hypothetical protein [Hafnia alvei]|nr:hypothetical protein [Hafnia alvei]